MRWISHVRSEERLRYSQVVVAVFFVHGTLTALAAWMSYGLAGVGWLFLFVTLAFPLGWFVLFLPGPLIFMLNSGLWGLMAAALLWLWDSLRYNEERSSS